jgi:hypothetical protein
LPRALKRRHFVPLGFSAVRLPAPATGAARTRERLSSPGRVERYDGHLVCSAFWSDESCADNTDVSIGEGLERTGGPVSPFHDLGQRCGSSLPAERAPSLASSGQTPAAFMRPGADIELQVISLPRFVRLLSLCVVGLICLLSLGVGGVALVIRELTAETSSSRAVAHGGPNASTTVTVGNPSAKDPRVGVRRQRWATQSGPAPRGPAPPSARQLETLETALLESSASDVLASAP